MFVRQRTALPAVLYGLYLVSPGLSFRSASRAPETLRLMRSIRG
ncbi:MAG: hypothetical protein QXM16_08760 [Nitrososphaerota archaeon]